MKAEKPALKYFMHVEPRTAKSAISRITIIFFIYAYFS